MNEKKFFALVGPTGAGKSELLKALRERIPNDQCVFPRDSSGCGNAPHIRFTTSITQISKQGIHEETTARSQLLVFWARLAAIIEGDVLPNLKAGKYVVMDGFGGTVLTHAMQSAQTNEERTALLELHKSLITHCVIGLSVPPPTYLWLKPSPEVAFERLRNQKKLPRVNHPLRLIEEINQWFDFYGTLPGQTVIPINADAPFEEVLSEALSIINHPNVANVAAYLMVFDP